MSGMALIAVLWIVAALSVMVIGVTQTVRQQITVTGTQREQIEGQALGEAAVALVLQQLQAAPAPPRGIVTLDVSYAGRDLPVQLAPLNGLISLGGAAPELLAALFQVAGGLPAGPAQALAVSVVAWREGRADVNAGAKPAPTNQPRQFEAVEDLMLIPGIDYGLYARVAPLVSADLRGSSRVNPAAAPAGVLAVLAQGNSGAVQQYLNQRNSGQPGGDTSGFNSAFVDTAGGQLYRLVVSVPLEAGKILRLTQDVALGGGASRTAPWRVLRTERQIAAVAG